MTDHDVEHRPSTEKLAAWRWAWVAAIFVWPLFAHGCHSGDHDDELAIAAPRQQEEARPD